MKIGFELELLAPPGKNRHSIAQTLAEQARLSVRTCFHRESEYWPGSQSNKPYFCLTKGFELLDGDQMKFRIVNDMTIEQSLNPELDEDCHWYHILSDDIRLIDLIRCQSNSSDATTEILLPIAKIFKTDVREKDGVHTVVGENSSLICGAHSKMADRNRICEIVTAPLSEKQDETIHMVLELASHLGCKVPKEGAFHMHFDGEAFASSDKLLKAIRYFYVWSDVLKTLIPPNPHCRRLGEYTNEIINYAFDEGNQNKPFEEVVTDLKKLGPTKYCDFNFNNILIGAPEKFTFEVRVVPMLLNADALIAAKEIYLSFVNFLLNSDEKYKKQKIKPSQDSLNQLLTQIS